MTPTKEAVVLEKIENLRDGVIGVKASGKVTADDYRDVLIPLLDEAKARGGKMRVLYDCGDLDITAGGAWQDTKTGISNWTSFEKIAIVTDEDWIEHSIKALGWIMPGEVKVFDDDDRDHAIEWLAED